LEVDRQSTPLLSMKISLKSDDQISRKLNLKISKNEIETLISAVVLMIELRSLHR